MDFQETEMMFDVYKHNMLQIIGAIQAAGGSGVLILTDSTNLLNIFARNNIIISARYNGDGKGLM